GGRLGARTPLLLGERGAGHPLRQDVLDLQLTGGAVLGEEVGQPVHRGEAPVLLAAGRHGEVRDLPGPGALAPGGVRDHRLGGVGVSLAARGVSQQAHQPTAPSIWSSMRRLSSRAYSIGSSLAMGSTKPRTIIAIASSSFIPRDIR